jgi:hypothetical protein
VAAAMDVAAPWLVRRKKRLKMSVSTSFLPGKSLQISLFTAPVARPTHAHRARWS